jgi:osmotically-inducible protein OsmY
MPGTRKLAGFLSVGLVAVMLSACAGGPERQSTGEYIDSAAITTRVNTAIARAEDLSVFKINVDTYRNIVQLSGFVDNESQRKRAEEIARNVDGVKEVRNNLQLR